MRATIPGLTTARPLGALLPACLQEDDFAMRWTAGFDDVLAPIFSTLDCLDAYLDPRTAPEDFLEWIAGWLGATLDEHSELSRVREVVAAAVGLHRMRGTPAGLRSHLELYSGGRVEIDEPGGVSWSQTPVAGFPAPGDAAESSAALRIRVFVSDPDQLSLPALHAVVDTAKPAHLSHTIEVVPDDRLP